MSHTSGIEKFNILTQMQNVVQDYFDQECSMKTKPIITDDETLILAKLGSGGFGSVYNYQDDKVVKIFATDTPKKVILRELKMIDENYVHENINKTIQCIQIERHRGIIMEKGEYDLFTYAIDIKNIHGQGFESVIINSFMRDLIRGISFLHSKRIYHCDLKLENVLCYYKQKVVDKEGYLIPNLKLCDFGLSHCDDWTFTDQKYGSLEKVGGIMPIVGSKNYLPPLSIATGDATKYLRDEWALGVILFIFAYGTFLYSDTSTEQLFINMLNIGFEDDKIQEIIKLIQQMKGKIGFSQNEKNTINEVYKQNSNSFYINLLPNNITPRQDIEFFIRCLIRRKPLDINSFAHVIILKSRVSALR